MKFWSNGGGSRLLNLRKSGEGHAFRYRTHKICKISNAFSAIQGAQSSKFPLLFFCLSKGEGQDFRKDNIPQKPQPTPQ